jgi:hypothetical protein
MMGAGVNERTLWADSMKRIEVSASNYGDGDIKNATLSWELGSVAGVRGPRSTRQAQSVPIEDSTE